MNDPQTRQEGTFDPSAIPTGIDDITPEKDVQVEAMTARELIHQLMECDLDMPIVDSNGNAVTGIAEDEEGLTLETAE